MTDPIRAALSQPEPAGLSDEELLKLMPQQFRDDLATVSRMAAYGAGTGVTPGVFRVSLNTGALEFARAAIAADRAQRHPAPVPTVEGEVGELIKCLRIRAASLSKVGANLSQRGDAIYFTRAADLLEQRQPVEPLPGEVQELVSTLMFEADAENPPTDLQWATREQLRRAADLLAQRHPQPVPVSERLPGPEDCAPWPQPSDNSGWCWMSRTVHGFYGSFAIWEQVSVVPTCREVYAHWLPAHALPVPEAGE